MIPFLHSYNRRISKQDSQDTEHGTGNNAPIPHAGQQH